MANDNEMNNVNPNQGPLIEIDPAVAPGVYSNLALVAHSNTEFVLDFASVLPGGNPRVNGRVILAPEHAKRLLQALGENVRRYEAENGPINLPAPMEAPVAEA